MPEMGNPITTPNTPINTGGAGKGSPSASYIRVLADMREIRTPFVTPQLYELENGDLLIKDAPLLAEGEWTDSAVQTPLYYTAKALQEFADNWTKRTGFNRHLKGVPRDESNRVSEAIAPRFGQFKDDEGSVHNAILSDILVYGSTPSGRAMQELIKRKQIKFLSVEHGGEEEYNPITGRMESKTLEFYGYAHVNKGACKVCRVNEEPMLKKDNSLEGLQVILKSALDKKFKPAALGDYVSTPWIVMTFPDRVIYSYDGKKFEAPYMIEPDSVTLGTPVEVEEVYVEKKALERFPGADPKELMAAIQKKQDRTMADTKELEAQIVAQGTLIKELSEAIRAQKPAEVKVEIPKELSEMPGQIKALSELVAAQAAKIKALEQDGTPQTDGTPGKELEEPINARISIDRKAGTIRSV